MNVCAYVLTGWFGSSLILAAVWARLGSVLKGGRND